jgi:hypothetical protein
MDSEPRHGRPSTNRNDNVIKQVRTLVMQDRRITVRELAYEVGVSNGSVRCGFGLEESVREIRAEAAAPSRQCTRPLFSCYSRFFG